MNREPHYAIPELGYWRSVVLSVLHPKVPVLSYVPMRRRLPSRVLPVTTAWKGIESVIEDIIERFGVPTRRALEFGVEYGYSTAVLSSFFEQVVGVDLFVGDKHTHAHGDIFPESRQRLSAFTNIQLFKQDYRDWIAQDKNVYDLIHVDIVHTYVDTFNCGLWSAGHAHCVLFHDTLSFPAVKQAVSDIARQSGKTFYNFEESNGLGILI